MMTQKLEPETVILMPTKSDMWAGLVSGTARHRRDVSSELRCPGASPRRWTPSLATRFDVIP